MTTAVIFNPTTNEEYFTTPCFSTRAEAWACATGFILARYSGEQDAAVRGNLADATLNKEYEFYSTIDLRQASLYGPPVSIVLNDEPQQDKQRRHPSRRVPFT
ncbi:hypothetical protein [Corynebacterium striatum]|uniref:hypothetical protein n=2 Tax=Corynebacteriaceae TaxID=1653 RepID=UPI000666D642|nr:hypothetical protein [Corynebacterium striatum]